MKRLSCRLPVRAGIALGAILFAVSASVAHGATTYKLTGTGSPKAGTKKAPAPFTGSFNLAGDAGPGVRPATPVTWAWSWEGVVIDGTGLPTCTPAMIDSVQSASICPKGSLVGVGEGLVAQFGPIGDPLSNLDCRGKRFEFYNGGPKLITLLVAGPPDQCGGIDYVAPASIVLSTKGKTTTSTLTWPSNITNPLPGLQATLNDGGGLFPISKGTVKQGKKKVKKAYMNDVGCKGPNRSFTFTVVDEEQGATTQSSSAGKCVVKKKKRKK